MFVPDSLLFCVSQPPTSGNTCGGEHCPRFWITSSSVQDGPSLGPGGKLLSPMHPEGVLGPDVHGQLSLRSAVWAHTAATGPALLYPSSEAKLKGPEPLESLTGTLSLGWEPTPHTPRGRSWGHFWPQCQNRGNAHVSCQHHVGTEWVSEPGSSG